MRTCLLVLAWLWLVVLGSAPAQDQYQPGGPAATSASGVYGLPWMYGGGWGYHSSTYEEGVQRGFADVVRSQGLANLYNAEAARSFEQARRLNIENRIAGTEAYFQMREYNRQQRAAERGPRPTTEALIRYAKQGLPKPLSDSELDPLSGLISWPEILRKDTFAASRKSLEALFAKRAAQGGLNPDSLLQLNHTVDKMRADLKTNINSYSPQAYLESKKFLDSLAFAALKRPT